VIATKEADRLTLCRLARAMLALVLAAAVSGPLTAGATGPFGAGQVGSRAGVASPAGPSPRNPAGPTPRNPAGPPPLNATGSFGSRLAHPRSGAVFGAGDPFFQPQPFVSVVGPSSVPLAVGGSFFCQVHGRGFATEQFFFDHLAVVDGLAPDEASAVLFENGGVWIYGGD
jgi:hypothetical protein